jgi:hypothetical protein
LPILTDTRVTLWFSGDALEPESISQLLRLPAFRAWRKGDVLKGKCGLLPPKKYGAWSYRAENCALGDLDAQIAEIFSNASVDLTTWNDLSKSFDGKIFFGWFMSSWNNSSALSAQTIASCAARGLKLDFDLYGPSKEEED